MKEFLLVTIAVILFGQYSLSQKDGGYFLKTIEYNIIMKGVSESDNRYNLEHKSTIDRLFFGETNSPIEFVIQTPFDGASGFRIIKDSSDDNHRIEIMSMPNSDKIIDKLSRKENQLLIPYELETLITFDQLMKINEYNKKVSFTKQSGKIYESDRVKSKSFVISKFFVEKLHLKMTSLIDHFKVEGIPPLIADGEKVTFRCVVRNELWTLVIHAPQNSMRQLSNLCQQIITDSKNNLLDESKYLNLLDKID